MLFRSKSLLSTSLVVSLLLGMNTFCLTPVFAEEKVLASGVAAVDIPESRAKLVRLEITDGHFDEFAVGKLALTLDSIDFRNGSLASLGVDMHNADFNTVWVDQMLINTNAFSFNTFELLNHRRFELDHPITGTVSLMLSENSLNHFVKHPKTLHNIEKAIQKKTGGLKVVTFSNPSLKLLKGNQVMLDMTMFVAEGIAMPMQFQGELKLKDGNLVFDDLTIASQNTNIPLPVDVTHIVEKQLNDMINLEKLGKKSFVIHADSLKMKKGMIEVSGHATFTRLEIGGKALQ